MGANLYDDALVEKLQQLINPGSGIKILKPEETTRLFDMKADESHDKITLPLIALSRKGYKLREKTKQPKSYDGITIRAYDKNGNLVNQGKALKLNAIPIHLIYQLDIYALNLDECEAYSREFIFELINNPTGVITIPYNDACVNHKFTVHVEEDIEDNSDIKERIFPGQFTRYTLGLEIDDAYLFSIPVKKNVTFEGVKVVVEDRQSHEEIEKINLLDKN